MVSMMPTVVLVHDRVPLATGYEPAVDRKRRHERHTQRERQTAPEQEASEARLHRTRDEENDRIVHDLHEIVIEIVSEAKASGSTVPSASPERKSGTIVSE